MNPILVTGSSGRIGRAVVQELQARGHTVRGFDRVESPGVSEMLVGTLTSVVDVARSMIGIHTVIHLAATPDDADFLAEIVPNNIVGVYHIFEEAQKAGVKRLIVASSGQVVWHQRMTGPLPIGVDTQPTPRYWYAAGKLFLEGAGRAFAEKFGMEVIAVRLGWCPRTPEQVEEIGAEQWAQDVYLSPGDAGRFFACAAEATLEQKFNVVYATSKPRRAMYDLETTRRLLGFEPAEAWPQGVDLVMSSGDR
ncbi:MAG: NAD(P)-dependent oxidoreductase [Planctomycetes bacterium]|jgi:NAD(P)-dependent dehydrogenase (short-subunit alcohol dehydrogenase family)|nr:NAD(P)-dependent oxidoreductase [Planctomycetota bacterium]